MASKDMAQVDIGDDPEFWYIDDAWVDELDEWLVASASGVVHEDQFGNQFKERS